MTTIDPKRKALGRGLESLLPRTAPAPAPPPNSEAAIAPPPTMSPESTEPVVSARPADPGSPERAGFARSGVADPAADGVREIPIELIDPNPYQTRTHMDEAALEELAASIRSSGVLQPIVVRYIDGGRYQLIAGQRRWAASQRAGKPTIPALVRQVSNEQAMEMTIIENLQREDLNAIEQAHAFERLSREFGLTQEQMSERTGKDRASISNFLRLLRLPESVQSLIADGTLTAGHGKALMMLPTESDMKKMAERIHYQSLSVRQTEELVHEWLTPVGPKPSKPERRHKDPNVAAIERMLEEFLGLRVQIHTRSGTSGKITLDYSSLDQFDGIVARLRRE
jgi:ParB family transcriptional regulator, chromosome partitioning protein